MYKHTHTYEHIHVTKIRRRTIWGKEVNQQECVRRDRKGQGGWTRAKYNYTHMHNVRTCIYAYTYIHVYIYMDEHMYTHIHTCVKKSL